MKCYWKFWVPDTIQIQMQGELTHFPCYECAHWGAAGLEEEIRGWRLHPFFHGVIGQQLEYTYYSYNMLEMRKKHRGCNKGYFWWLEFCGSFDLSWVFDDSGLFYDLSFFVWWQNLFIWRQEIRATKLYDQHEENRWNSATEISQVLF